MGWRKCLFFKCRIISINDHFPYFLLDPSHFFWIRYLIESLNDWFSFQFVVLIIVLLFNDHSFKDFQPIFFWNRYSKDFFLNHENKLIMKWINSFFAFSFFHTWVHIKSREKGDPRRSATFSITLGKLPPDRRIM